jgi:hypothetical protein
VVNDVRTVAVDAAPPGGSKRTLTVTVSRRRLASARRPAGVSVTMTR